MNKRKIKKAIESIVSLFKTKKIVPVTKLTENNKLLENKVALIIGGSGGIGCSIAETFINSGCKVIITGTKKEKMEKIIKKINSENINYITFDLTQYDSYDKKIQEAISIYGKIDILVYSAGIHSTKSFLDFLEVDETEYDNILNINLKALYFVCQKVSKYMINNKTKGHILLISSSTDAEPAWSPYRLSKWGIKGFTKGLAQTLLEHNIVVNAISPGSTATELLGVSEGDSIYTKENKIGRMILPNEIAEYAKLLVSTYGDMIIGDTIYISAGRGTIDLR